MIVKNDLSIAMRAQKRGDLETAESIYAQILDSDPADPGALHYLGLVRRSQSRISDSYSLLRRSIELAPGEPKFHLNLGIALLEDGHAVEAGKSIEKSIELKPNWALAYRHIAEAYWRSENIDGALNALSRAITLYPTHPVDLLLIKSRLLIETKRFSDAISSIDLILAQAPDLAEAHLLRGHAWRELGNRPRALSSYRRALKLDPDFFDAKLAVAVMIFHLGELAEARALADELVTTQPENSDARWLRALISLSAGDFLTGLTDYEWRDRQTQRQWPLLETQRPKWREPRGHRLLVWSEQGLGDEIFFAGWLQAIKDVENDVVVAVDSRMVSAFSRAFPHLQFVSRDERVAERDYDSHLPIGSIPKSLLDLGLDWKGLRKKTSYIAAGSLRVREVREMLSPIECPLVGISWRSERPIIGQEKSVSLAEMQPLLAIPGVTFVSLQYGDVRKEIADFENSTGLKILQLTSINQREDLEGHLATISICDAIVSVCNATAHFAGALGKRGFVLVTRGRSRIWYWSNRTRDGDSEWYSSLRLLDRPESGSWETSLREVSSLLQRQICR